jgi:hypothetical protein
MLSTCAPAYHEATTPAKHYPHRMHTRGGLAAALGPLRANAPVQHARCIGSWVSLCCLHCAAEPASPCALLTSRCPRAE